MRIELTYKNLGREKAKGKVVIEGKNTVEINSKIYAEFSKRLASSNINFDNGTIFAGFHTVGTYEIKELKD